ncbi:hypothetical protein EYR36_006896 [Pleurotus pulmonarius]|nr:hypothetical protein EYR36_006896 [Pleurotus pulmonarius]
MITFTPQKTLFLQEHSIPFAKAELLGVTDAFMDDFFTAWIDHFEEMEFLTADSDVQVFVKRRMLKLLKERLTEIVDTQSLDERTLLASPSPIAVRQARGDIVQSPHRHDPTRALLQRGLLPRASGSKRRRARLDASVVVPPIVTPKLTLARTRIRTRAKTWHNNEPLLPSDLKSNL